MRRKSLASSPAWSRKAPLLARVEPIAGPGICGADFPLKVAAIGEGAPIGYAEELRPPGSGAASRLRSRPAATRVRAAYPAQPQAYPQPRPLGRHTRNRTGRCRSGRQPPSRMRTTSNTSARPAAPAQAYPPRRSARRESRLISRCRMSPRRTSARRAPSQPYPQQQPQQGYPQQVYPQQSYPPAEQVPLGRERAPVTTGAVAVQPTATLACPIVSALDSWFASGVQPAAMKWFGVQVAEIRQISAYSCRGMNGQRGAKISEHAFGNALDIASFTLADGRKITVKDGWRGAPEEQGFLRDVHASACQHFSTVLAPGSNVVPLRPHPRGPDAAQRAAARSAIRPPCPGDLVAARAGYRFARSEPGVTGSIKRSAQPHLPHGRVGRDEVYDGLPRAVAGRGLNDEDIPFRSTASGRSARPS